MEAKSAMDFTETRQTLTEEAEKTKQDLTQRVKTVEAKVTSINETVHDYTDIVREIQTLFDRDYKEFLRDRKRWKSDFDQATKRAVSNFE